MFNSSKEVAALIGLCTARGAMYGFIGGALSGVVLFVIGALFGALIGAGLGIVFGLVNGIVIAALLGTHTPSPWQGEGQGGGPVDGARLRKKLTARCVIASLALDAVVIAIDCYALQTYTLTVAGVLGLPAIVISAMRLAKYVSERYTGHTFTVPPTIRLPDDPTVWPPAPTRR